MNELPFCLSLSHSLFLGSVNVGIMQVIFVYISIFATLIFHTLLTIIALYGAFLNPLHLFSDLREYNYFLQNLKGRFN